MFNKLNGKATSGFTIIEVVIVLAIAGLILGIVLVAVPQLQQSQRDGARRSDMGRFSAGLIDAAANLGNGAAPSNGVADQVFTELGLDTTYTLATSGANPTTPDIMRYWRSRECAANNTAAAASTRQFAVVTRLESNDLYCVDG